MEWKDIHDPKGEFDFHMEWSLVAEQFTPEEIQKMVESTGVREMVKTVNEHFKMLRGSSVMQLEWVGNRRSVVQF